MGILNKLMGSAVIAGGLLLLTGCEGFKWYDVESSESAAYYNAYPTDQYNSYRDYRRAMDSGQYHGNSSHFDKVYKPPKYYNSDNSSTPVSPSQYCTMVNGKCCYESTCTASCSVNPWCGGAKKKKKESYSIGHDSEYNNKLQNDLNQGY